MHVLSQKQKENRLTVHRASMEGSYMMEQIMMFCNFLCDCAVDDVS